MMMAGLALMSLGMWIGGGLATYLAVFAALLLAGLGKTLFDPAIQAYVGKQVPYQRRARAIGTIEMSWAGSSLLGIPLLGLMMQWAGWESAFWVLGSLGILGIICIYRWIPADHTRGAGP